MITVFDVCDIINSNLSITKTPTGVFNSGSLVTFTLSYQNIGPNTATGATITDILGAGLSGISASPAWNSISGTNEYIWSGINLASGATGSIVFTAMVITGTSDFNFVNTGIISFTGTDPFTDNNTSITQNTGNTPTSSDLGVDKNFTDF